MSAQYCDFPNKISKLIGSACQNSEERYKSSFTPHLAPFYLLVSQVAAFRSSAGTSQENHTANSSEKIRNAS